MKKCLLSAMAGALAMFLFLLIIANVKSPKTSAPTEYNHIDYVSNINSDNCFVCSGQGPYWGEDNVGIVNLNSFELLYLPINRYGDHGELIREESGVMISGSLIDQEANSYVNSKVFPDNAYAFAELTGVKYSIDRDSIQSHLCQNCLDSINSLWFTNQAPAEYAVVSLEKKTIQPLLNAHPWFSAGNYGIDCEFKDGGAIDLLIHYCPPRYQ